MTSPGLLLALAIVSAPPQQPEPPEPAPQARWVKLEAHTGSEFYHRIGLGLHGAFWADLAATEYGLAHNPSLREGNPFMASQGVRVLAHVGLPFAINYATEQVRKRGRPKLALWIRIGTMVTLSYAAIHNVRMAK